MEAEQQINLQNVRQMQVRIAGIHEAREALASGYICMISIKMTP